MSDAKGPYFINDLKKVGLCIGGPRLDETRYTGMSRYIAELVVDRLNFGYREGRASRDGLRKALDEILAISTIESMGQTEIAIKALEADEDSK